MESQDYWRLCDELNVREASLLIVGTDPSGEFVLGCDSWEAHQQPTGYAAARTALMNAIISGRLPATVRHSAREYGWKDQLQDIGGDGYRRGSTVKRDERLAANDACIFKVFPDWNLTTVSVKELIEWLRSRGVSTGFFFPLAVKAPDYLDPQNERYAPKLAAAVHAWQAVTYPISTSVKKALEKWLREHAVEFGQADGDGNPIAQAMAECSAVANWQPAGGAPKTPAG